MNCRIVKKKWSKTAIKVISILLETGAKKIPAKRDWIDDKVVDLITTRDDAQKIIETFHEKTERLMRSRARISYDRFMNDLRAEDEFKEVLHNLVVKIEDFARVVNSMFDQVPELSKCYDELDRDQKKLFTHLAWRIQYEDLADE